MNACRIRVVSNGFILEPLMLDKHLAIYDGDIKVFSDAATLGDYIAGNFKTIEQSKGE